MTADAAAIAIFIALLGGYYWARLQRAETANRAAKAASAAGGRQVWRARGAILLIGFVVFTVVNLWFRGRGR